MGSGYAYYLVPWHNSPGDGWGWTAGKAAADVAAMAGAGYLVFWGGTLIGWWGAAEVAADTVEVAGPIEATLVDVEYLLDTVITKITKIGL
jgi:hypothetical protein